MMGERTDAQMRVLAVDDEKIALEGLMKAIKEAEPSAEICGFRKASEALEYYKEHACDVAFLDVEMRSKSGVELAKEMKMMNPKINIIFATGYGVYREAAFAMHVSGYLTKPITAKKVRMELENLRYPIDNRLHQRIQIRTFGNFEIYADESPIIFKYDKTKEMLAYLVDRNGTYCTNKEIMAVLWQDKSHASYLSNLKKDMNDTLKRYDCRDIVEVSRGKIRICTEKTECDYFDWCQGKLYAINQYHGEYMTQYSWAEFTNGELNKNKQMKSGGQDYV